MVMIGVRDIGLCAEFSLQGEWAFDYALSVARSAACGLKIFYVPDLSWDTPRAPELPLDEINALDRRVREHYDPRLGDFTEAGFRICQGLEDVELHHCLMDQEYQVLVLAYRDLGARFAGRAIEEFAYTFGGPVVLVGPERPDQFTVNPSAALLSMELQLDQGIGRCWNPGNGFPSANSPIGGTGQTGTLGPPWRTRLVRASAVRESR